MKNILLFIFLMIKPFTCFSIDNQKSIHISDTPDGSLISEQYKSKRRVGLSDEKIKDLETQSLRIIKEGLSLHKKKKFHAAVKMYKRALYHYPTSAVYYFYGNSLSSLGHYEIAIKSYLMANENYVDTPKDLGITRGKIFYNIACAYSLMKDDKTAHSFLKKAVLYGYGNIRYINKDTDLHYLHSLPSWKIKYYNLKKLYAEGNKNKANNIMIKILDPAKNKYYFCKDGTVLGKYSHETVMDYRQLGLWNFKNNIIRINWIRAKGSDLGMNVFQCHSRGCEPTPFERKMDEKEEIHWQEIDDSEWITHSINCKETYMK